MDDFVSSRLGFLDLIIVYVMIVSVLEILKNLIEFVNLLTRVAKLEFPPTTYLIKSLIQFDFTFFIVLDFPAVRYNSPNLNIFQPKVFKLFRFVFMISSRVLRGTFAKIKKDRSMVKIISREMGIFKHREEIYLAFSSQKMIKPSCNIVTPLLIVTPSLHISSIT